MDLVAIRTQASVHIGNLFEISFVPTYLASLLEICQMHALW